MKISEQVWAASRSNSVFCPNPVESSVEYSTKNRPSASQPETSTGKLSKSTVCIRLSPGLSTGAGVRPKQGGSLLFYFVVIRLSAGRAKKRRLLSFTHRCPHSTHSRSCAQNGQSTGINERNVDLERV